MICWLVLVHCFACLFVLILFVLEVCYYFYKRRISEKLCRDQMIIQSTNSAQCENVSTIIKPSLPMINHKETNHLLFKIAHEIISISRIATQGCRLVKGFKCCCRRHISKYKTINFTLPKVYHRKNKK